MVAFFLVIGRTVLIKIKKTLYLGFISSITLSSIVKKRVEYFFFVNILFDSD